MYSEIIILLSLVDQHQDRRNFFDHSIAFSDIELPAGRVRWSASLNSTCFSVCLPDTIIIIHVERDKLFYCCLGSLYRFWGNNSLNLRYIDKNWGSCFVYSILRKWHQQTGGGEDPLAMSFSITAIGGRKISIPTLLRFTYIRGG